MKNTFLNKRIPNDNYFGVSKYLIIVNVVVYFLALLLLKNGTNILSYLGLSVPGIKYEYRFWQFFTYMFVHVEPMSLFFTCLELLFFGFKLERAIGSKEFLLFYFVVGLLSSLMTFVTWLIADVNMILIGSQIVINAVLFMYAMIYPYERLLFFFVIPMSIPFCVLLITCIQLVYLIVPALGGVAVNIIYFYGLIVAWIYSAVRMRMNPLNFWKHLFRR